MIKLRLAFAVLVLVAAFSSTPSSAWWVGYVCSGSYTSAAYTGYGSTCTSAHNDLVANLPNLAEEDCFNVPYSDHACNLSTNITSACSCNGGVCQESGTTTHSCARCGYYNGPLCP